MAGVVEVTLLRVDRDLASLIPESRLLSLHVIHIS